jgi:hypothetical protein
MRPLLQLLDLGLRISPQLVDLELRQRVTMGGSDK